MIMAEIQLKYYDVPRIRAAAASFVAAVELGNSQRRRLCEHVT